MWWSIRCGIIAAEQHPAMRCTGRAEVSPAERSSGSMWSRTMNIPGAQEEQIIVCRLGHLPGSHGTDLIVDWRLWKLEGDRGIVFLNQDGVRVGEVSCATHT